MESDGKSIKWSMLNTIRRAKSEDFRYGDCPPDIPEGQEPPLTPRSSHSVLSHPSTPPKKMWERQFRSFLKKKDSGQNLVDVEKLDSHPLSTDQLFSAQKHKFLLANISKTKPSSDMTVKGGNIFSHAFPKETNRGSAPSLSRQSKSMDTLDTTLRRGQEKGTSPTIQRRTNPNFIDEAPPVLIFPFNKGSIPHTSSLLAMRSAQASGPSNLSVALEIPDDVNVESVSHSVRDKNTSLPSGLAMAVKKPTSTEMKKAFTQFHNSQAYAKDSTSAFLGEDTSMYGNSIFGVYNQSAMPQNEIHNTRGASRFTELNRPISKSLDFSRESVIHKSQRVLKPVGGPETWNPGRRYLIAPSILATCPLQVLPKLSGSKNITTFEETFFGILELGSATITYLGKRQDSLGWSTCTLVLRQNYLLEYEMDVGITGIPRGFAHLQNAKAYPHREFLNALELEFFGSPCAKADKRKLLIRVDKTSDRDRWVTSLNIAANLTVRDLYDFDENVKIGQGRYASVFKARRRGIQDNSCDCAIKIVDKTEFWSRVVKNMERADTLVREASIQATLTSKGTGIPSVLKLSGLFETSEVLVFEVELLEGTDLFHHISTKNLLCESEAANIVHDILVCLDAMCRFGIAHRDIKPANILICDKARTGVHIKVADFGMATFAGVDGLLRGRCGTPGYVAPEIFSAGVHGGYSNKVDIFSTGVILYVMLCGYEPFYGETDAELILANKEANLDFPDADWKTISSSARNLVQAMLERDPNKRISAQQALMHPWITSHNISSIKSSSSEWNGVATGAACSIC